MIDFHCHLDLYERPEDVLGQVVARGGYLLAVTTTPLAVAGTRRLVGDAPRVRVAVGLHPELVATRHREVDQLCRLVRTSRYVGEIGLDGTPRHRGSMPLQQRVLDAVLCACRDAGGRIMTVHSRGATAAVLDAIERHPGAGTAVLHWFSGSLTELRRAVELGCWFSVGPAMVGGSKGRRLVEAMPPDRVLTETDGPFTRRSGGTEPLRPWDVAAAEAMLAEVWSTTAEQARERLLDNLRRLVSAVDVRDSASP